MERNSKEASSMAILATASGSNSRPGVVMLWSVMRRCGSSCVAEWKRDCRLGQIEAQRTVELRRTTWVALCRWIPRDDGLKKTTWVAQHRWGLWIAEWTKKIWVARHRCTLWSRTMQDHPFQAHQARSFSWMMDGHHTRGALHGRSANACACYYCLA